MAETIDNQDRGGREPALDFDALSADQIARLEASLNADPQRGAAFAQMCPGRDGFVDAWTAAERSAAPPGDRPWERVWEQVDTALTLRPTVTATGALRRPRTIRLWVGLAAAAACIALVSLWPWKPAPTESPWPIVLAGNVEIDALEVSDDATPVIWSTGGSEPVNVIWVAQMDI
jgi:hypothetical protein